MPVRKLLFFINPISGTANKQKLEKAIHASMHRHGLDFSIRHTRKDGNYEKEKQDAIYSSVTDIIICGGDGTINTIARYFMQTDIRIGIIPMGSGNGLAYALGIPNKIHEALDVIVKGNCSLIDTFRVNNHFACMLSGIGLDAAIAHRFAQQKRRGLFTYIRISALSFFNTGSYPVSLQTNNHQSIDTDIRFVSIANSNQFGNRVTIAPGASLQDGLLDVVVVQKRNRLLTVLSVLIQILFGKIKSIETEGIGQKTILYFQTKEITIHNPKQAPLHIDGEPVDTAQNIHIQITPSALLVIQPT